VDLILGLTLVQWAAIGSIMVALFSMLPRFRTMVKRYWRKTFGKSFALLERHIASEEIQLNRIEAELHSNGGNSLRDEIRQIIDTQFKFEAHLNASMNVHQVALFRTDASGGVIASNRAHQILTGFNVLQLQGDGWINVICPKDRERVMKAWKAAVEAQREFSEDICYIKPDGTLYDVHVTVYREKSSDDKVRGYVGIVVPKKSDAPCPYADGFDDCR
jgi:PAS domain S-box-containing protein